MKTAELSSQTMAKKKYINTKNDSAIATANAGDFTPNVKVIFPQELFSE
jgi:hypothetical protein